MYKYRVIVNFFASSHNRKLFFFIIAHTEIHTPNAYRYHDVGMDIRGATSLLFEVTACNDAHVLLMTNPGDENQDVIEIVKGKIELRREKIGIRGFRPVPTQTGLYSYRR